MKFYFSLIIVLLIYSCVPSKKYTEVVNREQKCLEELEKHKNSAITSEQLFKEEEAKRKKYEEGFLALSKDTFEINEKYRQLQTQYDRVVLYNIQIEKTLDTDKETRRKQTGKLQNDLDSKNIELQRKEDVLKNLEKELKVKQNTLNDKERKIIELEEALKKKEDGVKMLKNKIAQALKGQDQKNFSIIEKKGKIYVSLDAKLLFLSGKIEVEEAGKKALIDLAKILEKEKDMEIIVEGHTDTDKLAGINHPKNNWELSVMRASSVVEIMLQNSKLNPTKVMASGRSEFHPLDPKDKNKNRRIEIIIAPNLSALYQLIENK
ncbi:MAG: OmpA family protein [Flavobacteriia bacterium]|nr:OmpA family protein [Flavobacteriia bacterium]